MGREEKMQGRGTGRIICKIIDRMAQRISTISWKGDIPVKWMSEPGRLLRTSILKIRKRKCVKTKADANGSSLEQWGITSSCTVSEGTISETWMSEISYMTL